MIKFFRMFVVLISFLLISGCQLKSTHAKYVQPTKINFSTPASNAVQTATPGTILYRKANLKKYSGLVLTSDIKIKSKSMLIPNLNMKKGTLLLINKESKEALYYIAMKKKSTPDSYSPMGSDGHYYGLKKNKSTGLFEGVYLIGNFTAHTYKIPTQKAWEKHDFIIKNKGYAEQIQFLGIKSSQLLFKHYLFEHKERLFTSSHINGSTIYKMKIDDKKIKIHKHTIEVFTAKDNSISYKIS